MTTTFRQLQKTLSAAALLLGATFLTGFAECGGPPKGTCAYNGKTYAAGDSFPSADGCNTCTCSAGGAVACTERACAGTAWLTIEPIQCAGNPWEMATSKGDGTDPSYPTAEHLAVDNYFEDQGIDLLEVGFLYPPMPIGVCKACTCPRGDRLLVRANAVDVSTLVTRYGFTTVKDGEAQALSPRQCNNNPWTAPAPGEAGLRPESELVQSWLAKESAPSSQAGFAFPTTTVGSCAACTCGRGDRLVAFPADPTAAGKLPALGFTPLPSL